MITCRRGVRLLAGMLGLLALTTGHAQQHERPKAPPPPASSAVEPKALELLKATSDRLAGAKSMSFTAVTTYESPGRNGQPLYYATRSEVLLQRPDKLRVITPGDGPASRFYYDGKTMTAYAPGANLLAVAPAPPTIEATMKSSYDKAAIYFPFAEVIVGDPYKSLTEGLTSAFVVGQSTVVGDTATEMVAISKANLKAELWIGAKDGLPRMIRAIYPNDPAKPRYEIEFSNWRLDPPVTAADFAFAPPEKATRQELGHPDAPPQSKP